MNEHERAQNDILAGLRAKHDHEHPKNLGNLAQNLIRAAEREWECPHCGVIYKSSFGRMTCGTDACHLRELEVRGMKPEVSAAQLERQRIDTALERASVPMRFWPASLQDFGDKAEEYRWRTRRSVRIHGKVGRGKTHLAVALLKAAYIAGTTERGTDRVRPGAFPVQFCRALDYLKAIKSTFRRNSKESEAEVLRSYSLPEVLVLDDVGAEAASDYGWSELLALLESRGHRGKTTIVTTNLTLVDIFRHEPRIGSRLKEWRTIELDGDDRRASP